MSEAMRFGEALEAMRSGRLASRKSWPWEGLGGMCIGSHIVDGDPEIFEVHLLIHGRLAERSAFHVSWDDLHAEDWFVPAIGDVAENNIEVSKLYQSPESSAAGEPISGSPAAHEAHQDRCPKCGHESDMNWPWCSPTGPRWGLCLNGISIGNGPWEGCDGRSLPRIAFDEMAAVKSEVKRDPNSEKRFTENGQTARHDEFDV